MFVTLENIISNCLLWKKDSHCQNIDVVMMIDFHLPNFRYCGFCWHGLSRIYRGNPIKWVCFLRHPHDHNLDYDLSDNGSHQNSNYFFNFQSQSFLMKGILLIWRSCIMLFLRSDSWLDYPSLPYQFPEAEFA